jgi:hypothetical protein
MKTKIPWLFYTWIFLSVMECVCIFIFFKGVFQPLISAIIISALFYYILCRYTCVVTFERKKILINYLLFFHEDIEIEIDKIEGYDFRKGILGFNESFENSTNFKIIFYDTIYLKMKDGNRTVKIHARTGVFNKIREYIDQGLNVKVQ